MAKPPPSSPHSDLTGADRDHRAGLPNTDPKPGTGEDIAKVEKQPIGRPPDAGKMRRDTPREHAQSEEPEA